MDAQMARALTHNSLNGSQLKGECNSLQHPQQVAMMSSPADIAT